MHRMRLVTRPSVRLASSPSLKSTSLKPFSTSHLICHVGEKDDPKATALPFNMNPMFVVNNGLNHALHMHVSQEDFDLENLAKSQFSKKTDREPFSMHVPLNQLVKGSVAALADTTIGIGAITHLPKDSNRMALVELDIHYVTSLDVESGTDSVSSGPDARLECQAKPIHKGKSMQVWDARVQVKRQGTSDDNTVCLVRGTVLNLYPVKQVEAMEASPPISEFDLKSYLQSSEQALSRSQILSQNVNKINGISVLGTSTKNDMIHCLQVNELSRLLNVELVNLDPNAGAGFILESRMKIDQKHMAGTGMVHGGSINSLAECSLQLASTMLNSQLSQMKIHFVSSSATIGDEFVCRIHISESNDRQFILDATISHNFADSSAHTIDSRQKVTAYARGTSTIRKVDSEESNNSVQSLDKKRLEKLGTRFNIDTMSKKQIRERFDKHSENWVAFTTEFKYFPVFEWIRQNCGQVSRQILEKGRIFDLACGVGLVAKELRRSGMKGNIVGLDISVGMLQRAFETECYSSVICHDLDNDLPFTSAKFDIVTCCGATEMLSNVDHFLAQLKRMLSDDGEAWITFQYKTDSPNPIAHQGMKEYSKSEIERMMTRNGFELLNFTVTQEAYFLPSPTDKSKLVAIPFAMVRAKALKNNK